MNKRTFSAMLALWGSILMLALVGIATFILWAYLLSILIGLGVILLLAGVAISVRLWQHSGLKVAEARREELRLQHEQEMERERLQIERDRHEHEMTLAQERHT